MYDSWIIMTKTQKTIIFLVATVFMPAAWLYSQAQELDSPYMNKELSELMSVLTFQMSFDSESIESDMALGESTPTIHASYNIGKHPELEHDEGILGKGLILGSGALTYLAEGNIPLENCGAITFWIKPLEWKRPNGDNSTFFMLRSRCFYIQRQGPKVDKEKIRRHEHVMCGVKVNKSQQRFTCLYAGDQEWENGQWYFITVNWDWPTFSASVNGKPFMTKSLKSEPAEEFFSSFSIGSRGGEKGVIDEVMIFNRPLNEEETNLVYKTVLNWKK